jgi:hypothetical protein
MDKEFSLHQINARMFVLERELAKAREQKMKLEEHCTLILGKFVLAQIRKRYGEQITLADTQYLSFGDTCLAQWLADDNERRVFGLPLLNEPSPSPPLSPAVSSSGADYSLRPHHPLSQPYTVSSLTVSV